MLFCVCVVAMLYALFMPSFLHHKQSYFQSNPAISKPIFKKYLSELKKALKTPSSANRQYILALSDARVISFATNTDATG